MGGTTAKICLIDDQTPRSAKTFEVARTHRFTKGSGMPISIPVIEMIEIGAGGGSIASVDDLKQIRVGPLSAGSEPWTGCIRIRWLSRDSYRCKYSLRTHLARDFWCRRYRPTTRRIKKKF